MNTSKTNVIVYVQQPVPQGRARVISAALNTLHGVVRAENSKRTENAICVDYDPAVIDSQFILQCVREQGVTARLVGM